MIIQNYVELKNIQSKNQIGFFNIKREAIKNTATINVTNGTSKSFVVLLPNENNNGILKSSKGGYEFKKGVESNKFYYYLTWKKVLCVGKRKCHQILQELLQLMV